MLRSRLAPLLLTACLLAACQRAPDAPPTAVPPKPAPTTAPAAPGAPAGQPTAAAAAKPTEAAAKPAATTAPAPAAAARPGGEIVFGKEQEAPGLDPAKNPSSAAIRLFDLMYSRLTRLDDQMRPQPDLAERWEQPDSLTYVFYLRKGVKFHNGRDLTAADIKFTYDRILNPETASIARSFFAQIDRIETPDDFTVRFILKEPFAPFLVNTASPWAGIVAREIVEANNGDLNKVEAGSGPFKLAEREPDNRTVLVKNADYYIPGQPVVDKITYMIMTEESARIAAMRTGQIHLTTLTAAGADTLKSDTSVRVLQAPTLSYGYLGMNVERKPFDDVRVRQAVSLAVDRGEIVQTVYRGNARLTGPVPTAMAEWAVDPGRFATYKADVDKAKQLMQEAGQGAGFRTTMMAMSTMPTQVESAQVIQAQLKRIGIEAEIQPLEVGVYVDNWTKKAMDMMVGGNGAGTNPDRAVCFFFCTSGTANVWNFTDPRIDELAGQARQTTDQQQAKQQYEEAQVRIVDLAPNLFLANPDQFLAQSPRLVGFKPMPDQTEQYLIQAGLSQ